MTDRRFRFRSLLALLVIATALPVTLFSSYLVWRYWNQQGAMIDRQNIDLARAISVAVDGRSIRPRGQPRLRGLPAIALTAFGRGEDRQQALAAGFDLHLGKPVEPAALVRAVALLAARPAWA